MKTDEYGEVINHKETYKEIVRILKLKGSVVIGWTDEQMTHFDILFCICKDGTSNLQGGLRLGDLFVAIMRIGAFAFRIGGNKLHGSYIDEKLGVGRDLGSTADKLADLINNIKIEYVKLEKSKLTKEQA